MISTFPIHIKTLFGFEDILAEELKQLGATHIQKYLRMVSVSGDTDLLYRINLACRTAIKVLKPIFEFSANNEKEFYNGIMSYDWSRWMTQEDTLAVNATTHSDLFTHSQYVSLLTKDAIVDQFRSRTGQRPNVDPERPVLRVNIHIQQNQCSVSIDSSGDSLHLRGYRQEMNMAPINEVLAAGLLLLSGWKGQCDFLDPMCGTGTILIEAAMIARHMAPNMERSFFAFQNWRDYDEKLFMKIKEELKQQVQPLPFRVKGFDMDFTAVKKARMNLHHILLDDCIDVIQQDFFKSTKESEGPLFIFFNPPYNERIKIDIAPFYAQIGNTLKRQYPGSEAWFITSNAEALKHVGLKPSQKIKTFNGSLESRLVQYLMYEGGKRRQED